MSLWEAVVLGVIQGLTEFLPISSTAHLLVARQLMGHDNPRDAFTTAIQLGTLVAVFVYFRSDLYRLAAAVLGDLRAGAMAAAWGVSVAWIGGGVAAAVLAVVLALAFPALVRYRPPTPGAAPEQISSPA